MPLQTADVAKTASIQIPGIRIALAILVMTRSLTVEYALPSTFAHTATADVELTATATTLGLVQTTALASMDTILMAHHVHSPTHVRSIMAAVATMPTARIRHLESLTARAFLISTQLVMVKTATRPTCACFQMVGVVTIRHVRWTSATMRFALAIPDMHHLLASRMTVWRSTIVIATMADAAIIHDAYTQDQRHRLVPAMRGTTHSLGQGRTA